MVRNFLEGSESTIVKEYFESKKAEALESAKARMKDNNAAEAANVNVEDNEMDIADD